MSLTPSPFQERIYEFVRTGTGSAVVVAVAGSGKTTTIINALQYIPPEQTVQLLAFNKSIATELQTRIERLEMQRLQAGLSFPSVKASTFHSACFAAVRGHLEGLRVEVTPRKLHMICRDWLTRTEMDLYSSYICKLVGLAKGSGVGALIPDETEIWNVLTEHHDLTLDSTDADEEEAIQFARDLLKRSTEQAEEDGLIDFDDQLYLVCKWNLILRPYDWVFVDEAQDTNPVRRAIARKALKDEGRLIAVGDPHQAIYGFTGASHDAIDLIQEAFKAERLPLSVCYRCAKVIVTKAKTIVPQIEPAETAEEGKIHYVSAATVGTVLSSSDAILCRNTAPLVSAAYSLIAKGIGCTILGRDIGEGLVGLVEKQRAKGIEALDEKLGIYLKRETEKLERRDQPGKAAAVRDRVECIRTIMDHLDELERTVPGLITKIRSIFTEGGNVLTLSTIHKAKGREWPKVGILRPDLIPSKWATKSWQLTQEQNLQYVAWTRAQQELFLLDGELV